MRGREFVHLDLLSSVAVVGQGRPSLGDAHYQFFWRNKAKYIDWNRKISGKNKMWVRYTINMEATQKAHYVV